MKGFERKQQKVKVKRQNLALLRVLLRLLPGSLLLGIALQSQVAHAYPIQANLVVQREVGESYDALAHKAEAAARATAQRSFDSDILVNEVAITVLGDSDGLVAPVLVLSVNRNDWRNRPDPRRWATYFRSSRILLGNNSFGRVAGSSQPTPSLSTSPSPPASTVAPQSAPAVLPNSSQPAQQDAPSNRN